jgi:predicted acyl esterase
MVPMRDGVRLATDVYLPEGQGIGRGRRPAVLVRLPYDKAGRYTFMPMLAPHVTERGYAFVVQDVRGKFRSEGETVPFIHEVEDGYDTLEWLVGQAWSNRSVVMFGDSYYGFTQWATVASEHPSLRAIAPRVTSADLATLNWSGGGVTALYGADYLAHYWTDNPIYDFAVDWSHRPLVEVFDEAFAAIGARSRGFDILIGRETKGTPSPNPFPDGHPFDRLAIPVLHGVGWFDNLAPDSMRDYLALVRRKDRSGLQFLVADSIDHENYRLDDVPFADADFHDTNDEAIARMIPMYLGPALEFFDAVLAGDLGQLPRARWHLGNDGWRESTVWPPDDVHEVRLFLAGASRASNDPRSGGAGRLTSGREAAPSTARWLHDPADLVPSTVKDPFAFLFEHPDEREVERRPDVLSFTGEPVEAPLDLVGPAAAWLRVDTSGTSMHVIAKLLDVAPDGSAHMLTRGQVAVTKPDPDRLVRIDLNQLGYRLPSGHALRLQVASSDFPLYLPHPGTADNPWLTTRAVSNEQTLLTGDERSSYLTVSVLPE